MKWDNLTMSQKQALMKIYVNNGVTNLDEIRNHYNRFDDGGPKTRIVPLDINEDFTNLNRFIIDGILNDTTSSGYVKSMIATDPNGNPVRIYNVEDEYLPKGYTKGHKKYEDKVKEARKKFDYIGGDEESRYTAYLSKTPELTNMVDSLSKVYNINPDIMYERLGQEGFLDKEIDDYNYEALADEQKTYFDNVLNRHVNAFNDLGLDTAGELLNKGLLDMKWKDENLGYSTGLAFNEKGQAVQTVDVPNLASGLEIKAAFLEYLTKMMKERYPNASNFELDALVNGAYNLGQYHKDLKDVDYISTRYNVSPWSKYLIEKKYPDFKLKSLKQASIEDALKESNKKKYGGKIKKNKK